jgi:hypothetical protein
VKIFSPTNLRLPITFPSSHCPFTPVEPGYWVGLYEEDYERNELCVKCVCFICILLYCYRLYFLTVATFPATYTYSSSVQKNEKLVTVCLARSNFAPIHLPRRNTPAYGTHHLCVAILTTKHILTDYLLLFLAADLRMDPALRSRLVSSVAFAYFGNAYNSTTRLNDGIFTVHRFFVATSARLH